jgi:hypothetical protein
MDVLFSLVLLSKVLRYRKEELKCGENLTWSFNNFSNELTITGTGNMTDYSSDIKAPWDTFCASIESIEIENEVTSIGKYSFSGCSQLTTITIPDNVTSIGYFAFRGCTSLTSINIPITSQSSLNIYFATVKV